MSMLRSTSGPFNVATEADVGQKAFAILLSRMIRFNLALYMTFLSILLLGIAALSFL